MILQRKKVKLSDFIFTFVDTQEICLVTCPFLKLSDYKGVVKDIPDVYKNYYVSYVEVMSGYDCLTCASSPVVYIGLFDMK